MDDDFGVVKEEISDEAAKLPYFHGRVVGWLVTADASDAGSLDHSRSCKGSVDSLPQHLQQQQQQLPQRTGGIGDSRPPSFHANLGSGGVGGGGRRFDPTDTETETESMVSSRRPGAPHLHHGGGGGGLFGRGGGRGGSLPRHDFVSRSKGHGQLAALGRHGRHLYQDTTTATTTTTGSSMMSSDLESTSYWDSDDDLTCSRFSETTGTTAARSRGSRFKKRRRRHRLPPQMNRASSFSSITDSTLSLNIITVTLNMDVVNFLGISIVGQSNKGRGDGGIYVGSIMKGGAVAQDGRIEPGDMILQVNQVSLENMSNDEAVRVLREAVQKPGPIKLIVAKCWDPSPTNYFAVPRQEPIRPIDPSAWVAHTEAVRQQEQYEDYGSLGPLPPGMAPPESLSGSSFVGGPPFGPRPPGGGVGGAGIPGVTAGGAVPTIPRMGHPIVGAPGSYPPRPGPMSPSLTDLTSTSSSINSMLETERLYEDLNLTTNSDVTTVAKAMAAPDSGLEIRDRMWLKITIPNAFIGSDVVDWLYNHVEGFQDRREARKYAVQMLKQGFIRHTVNKSSFSEQCYYVMAPRIADLGVDLEALRIDDFDSVSEIGGVGGGVDAPFRGVGVAGLLGGKDVSAARRGYYQGPPYMTGGVEGGAYVPPPMGYTPQPYVAAYNQPLDRRAPLEPGERSGSQDSLESGSTASGGSKKGEGRKSGGGVGEGWFKRQDQPQHSTQPVQHLQQHPGSGHDSDSTSQAGSVISASDQSSLLQKPSSGRSGAKTQGGGAASNFVGALFGHHHHQPYDGPASFVNGADAALAASPRPPIVGGDAIDPSTPASTSGAAITTIQARLLQHHLHPVVAPSAPPVPPPKPLISTASAPPSYNDAVASSASSPIDASASFRHLTTTVAGAPQNFLQPSIKL